MRPWKDFAVGIERRGWPVNHKRVARLMREDNLLAAQPKAFATTTDSDHPLEVYLNLAKRMKLSGINSTAGSQHLKRHRSVVLRD